MTEVLYVSPDAEGGQSRDVRPILGQKDECLSKMKSKKYLSYEPKTFSLTVKWPTLYQFSEQGNSYKMEMKTQLPGNLIWHYHRASTETTVNMVRWLNRM